MSVVIIIDPAKGKAAITALQNACARGEVNQDEAEKANAAIATLIALAKTKLRKGQKLSDE